MYQHYLNCEREYYKHHVINGMDLCIFGIDSTCLTVGSLNNSGTFSLKSKENFENYVSRLKQNLGEDRFSRVKGFPQSPLGHFPQT